MHVRATRDEEHDLNSPWLLPGRTSGQPFFSCLAPRRWWLASHTIVPKSRPPHFCKRQHSCQLPQPGAAAAPPAPRPLGAADLLGLGWPTGAMDFLTEEDLELLEPAPDIHALFVHYNELYFESRLGACSGALR